MYDGLDNGEDEEALQKGLRASDGAASLGDAAGYRESTRERNIVRSCGSGCCILTGLLSLSWVFHAFPVVTVTDVPGYARSLIWMSLAHRTADWQELQQSVSPPPPSFGDGSGFFAPAASRARH